MNPFAVACIVLGLVLFQVGTTVLIVGVVAKARQDILDAIGEPPPVSDDPDQGGGT